MKKVLMREDLRIVEVDYGLGSYMGDHIQINKNLPPALREKILKHERQHHKPEYRGLKAWLIETPTLDSRLLWFMITNPKSLYNFYPFYNGYFDSKLFITELIFFILILLIIGGIIFKWIV